ncbi:DUF6129 family protein [Dechloromonas sp. HYN0024]|uniref:DUF6129 family protein n=1 Tax=Dechloromonas sp. HYN0024 TaxID=2231055 RepID=UPI000E42F09F|nr:DUF6129 family protein [Dechloromonas sp. HYN0024]AXS79726.1 hypothetical protein HYN24_06680 [Dechloromonas sp. HYN0024]
MITPTILARVGEAALLDGSASALRQRFPDLHFSECSEDDVSPRYRPAFTVEGYDLFLISGATGHCLEMTNDADAATGILIATKVDDE